jgi:hypothetical protein
MVLTGILIAKIAVTMVVVVGLSLIAEHVSTRLAGILAGYPHGIAIVLYFIGLEQGVEFAAQASIYAIGGLAANILLAYVYFLICRQPRWINLFLASVGGVAAFLSFSFILTQFKINQLVASLVAVTMIILVAALLRGVKNIPIGQRVRIRYLDIFLRALLATMIVLMITQAAYVIGPDWAGLLAGFPVVTFPLLLIIHIQYGQQQIATMVKNYPFGLMSLVVFTLTVSFAFPTFGMNLGTLIGFIVATIYLVVQSSLVNKRPLKA